MVGKGTRWVWVLVIAMVLVGVAAPVVARGTLLRARTPLSSPSQKPPRPAPGVAPRDTYALTRSEAWSLAGGAFGPPALWTTYQVTSLVSVKSTAGKALQLIDPLRSGYAPADSTVWVFEATGRFQGDSGVVANPPVYGAVWALVVKGTPGVLSAATETPINLAPLGPVTPMPLSALDNAWLHQAGKEAASTGA